MLPYNIQNKCQTRGGSWQNECCDGVVDGGGGPAAVSGREPAGHGECVGTCAGPRVYHGWGDTPR